MLTLRKEAEQDLKEAYEWHELQQKNIGIEFIDEIEIVINKIEETPQRYGKIYKNIRSALCKRYQQIARISLRHPGKTFF